MPVDTTQQEALGPTRVNARDNAEAVSTSRVEDRMDRVDRHGVVLLCLPIRTGRSSAFRPGPTGSDTPSASARRSRSMSASSSGRPGGSARPGRVRSSGSPGFLPPSPLLTLPRRSRAPRRGHSSRSQLGASPFGCLRPSGQDSPGATVTACSGRRLVGSPPAGTGL